MDQEQETEFEPSEYRDRKQGCGAGLKAGRTISVSGQHFGSAFRGSVFRIKVSDQFRNQGLRGVMTDLGIESVGLA